MNMYCTHCELLFPLNLFLLFDKAQRMREQCDNLDAKEQYGIIN